MDEDKNGGVSTIIYTILNIPVAPFLSQSTMNDQKSENHFSSIEVEKVLEQLTLEEKVALLSGTLKSGRRSSG